MTSQESELVERLEPSLGQGQSEEGQGVEKDYERRQQSLQQLLSHPNHTSPRKRGAKSTDPDGVSVCLEFREQDTSTHSSTHSVNVFSVGALPFAPAGLRAASPPATPRSLWCPSPHRHARPPVAVPRSVHIGMSSLDSFLANVAFRQICEHAFCHKNRRPRAYGHGNIYLASPFSSQGLLVVYRGGGDEAETVRHLVFSVVSFAQGCYDYYASDCRDCQMQGIYIL
jgi:hypothetical protein